MSRYVSPVFNITDSNGAPMVGAKLVFYATGTETLKTVYSDAGLTTPITNPVTAVSSDAGAIYPDIYLDGVYKVVQQDDSGTADTDDGAVLWTRDPVGDIAVGNFGAYLNDTTYNTPDVVYATDDNYYYSRIDANQGNEPAANPTEWQLIPVSTMAGTDAENVFTAIQTLTNTQILAKGADIASATALTIGSDGNYFDVTGTTAITSINAVGIGTVIKLHFDGILTLTHNATDLILPGSENITTADGDEAEFVEYAEGDWRCTNYQKHIVQPIELVILDAPEVLTTATTVSTWVTVDSATLNTAGAKKAIIRISVAATVGATSLGVSANIRKTGSGLAVSESNKIARASEYVNTSTGIQADAIGETTVNLDSNSDFDYYISSPITSVTVTLVGYYV